MNKTDPILDRLLRSAGLSKDEQPIEMPFGFDTRVLALRQTGGSGENGGLARLLRGVAAAAALILIITGVGIYNETSNAEENSEPFADEFVIADSAIQSEFSP